MCIHHGQWNTRKAQALEKWDLNRSEWISDEVNLFLKWNSRINYEQFERKSYLFVFQFVGYVDSSTHSRVALATEVILWDQRSTDVQIILQGWENSLVTHGKNVECKKETFQMCIFKVLLILWNRWMRDTVIRVGWGWKAAGGKWNRKIKVEQIIYHKSGGFFPSCCFVHGGQIILFWINQRRQIVFQTIVVIVGTAGDL